MSISKADLAHLARLAHLDLTEEESQGLARDLESILAYMARLQAQSGETAGPHLAGEGTPLRDDVPAPSLDAARATQGAPDAAHGLFRVPPVLGGE